MKSVIFILVFLSLVGCTKKAKEKFLPTSDQGGQVQDDHLDLSQIESQFQLSRVLGLDNKKNQNLPILTQTSDIFRLAEYSMNIGLKENQSKLLEFGHYILNGFYGTQSTTTKFDKTSSLYLEAALGLEGANILRKFEDLGSTENIKKIENIVGCASSQMCLAIEWPETSPNYNLKLFSESIRSYLTRLSTEMRKKKVSKEFLSSFNSQIEKDYITILLQAEKDLENISLHSPIRQNADTILSVFKTISFIPQDALAGVLGSLEKASTYGTTLEKERSLASEYSKNILNVIANIWLDLNEQQRKLYIETANQRLYEALNSQSHVFIQWLAGRIPSVPWKGSGIKEFFPESVRNGYTSRLEKSCHGQVFDLTRDWQMMSSEQRSAFSRNHTKLHNILSQIGSKNIQDKILKEFDSDEKEFDDDNSIVRKFISDIAVICLDGLSIQIDRALNEYTFNELDSQIRKWGPLIQDIVARKTLDGLKEINKSISSPEQFADYFRKMAQPKMDQMIFKGQKLPGLERNNISLKMSQNQTFYYEPTSFISFETGTETLGSSLAANYYLAETFDEIKPDFIKSNEYYRLIFSNINKMLSMIGFKKYDGTSVRSLHRKVSGEIYELDVYKYDCSPKRVSCQKESLIQIESKEDCSGNDSFYKSAFYIPDSLVIENAFEPVEMRQGEGIVSIEAQAELIRGAALMTKYFKDWGKTRPDNFDKSLGSETFANIEIFPKPAFVNLSVGLMTLPIRGFKKPLTPIRLFDIQNQELLNWQMGGVELESHPVCETPQEILLQTQQMLKQVAQASFSDIINGQVAKKVELRAMAKMILALDEFLKSTEGIEKTNATMIKSKSSSNLKSIKEGRELLSKIMLGASVFIVKNMYDDETGLFYSNFDLSNLSPKGHFNSVDQLYAIEALIRVYEHWGTQGMLDLAIQSYFNLNKFAWDSNSGFYNLGSEANLMRFTQVIYTLDLLKKYVGYESGQEQAKINLNRLQQVYLNSLLDFSSKILNTPH